MPRFEITVKVWSNYVLEVVADSESEACETALEEAEFRGTPGDSGQDIEDIIALYEEEEDD